MLFLRNLNWFHSLFMSDAKFCHVMLCLIYTPRFLGIKSRSFTSALDFPSPSRRSLWCLGDIKLHQTTLLGSAIFVLPGNFCTWFSNFRKKNPQKNENPLTVPWDFPQTKNSPAQENMATSSSAQGNKKNGIEFKKGGNEPQTTKTDETGLHWHDRQFMWQWEWDWDRSQIRTTHLRSKSTDTIAIQDLHFRTSLYWRRNRSKWEEMRFLCSAIDSSVKNRWSWKWPDEILEHSNGLNTR